MLRYLLLLSMTVVGAEDPVTDESADESVGERPSLALLEFLGSFESADGEWLDPLSLPSELDDTSDQPKDQIDDTRKTEPEVTSARN